MVVAINGNRHQENNLQNITELVNELIRRDVKVIMSDRFLDYLQQKIGPRFALGIQHLSMTQKPRADLAIAIGGDGAFLKTAAWIGDSATPVAGINTGHLGFLAAFSFDRPEDIARYLVNGEIFTETRSLLEVQTPTGVFHALNEAAITRGENASMVTIDTLINGHHSLTYKGDGLIIATPTGSTAYNLSVGGPILDPSIGGWVMAPIAAHSLSIRPLVINDAAIITANVQLRASTFRLSLDGRSLQFPSGTTLNFRKAPFSINVVTIPGHTFTDTLRSKLGLGI
jgi:NAD+ kinase